MFKNKFFHSPIFFFISALLICLLGGVIINQTTTWGPWAFSDSSVYVSAAKNFTLGNGFVIQNSNGSFTQMTEFPPFYSIFLSLFLGSDGDASNILRWVNIFLFMTFIAILGCLLYYFTKNNVLSALGMLLCVSAPVILEIFSGVMSETLFLPLLLGILFLASIYIRKGEAHIFVLLTAFSALLPITRYAGALFIGVTAILIFMFSSEKMSVRLMRIFAYITVSLLPLGLWFFKLYSQFSKVGGKNFNISFDIFHSLISSILVELDVIKNWLPYYGIYDSPLINRLLIIGALVLFTALIILFIKILNKKDNKRILNLFIISISYLSAYSLFIAFTHSITIPQIDIIDRMMVPLFPFFIGIIISGLAILSNNKHRLLSIMVIAILLVALRFNFLTSQVFIDEMRLNGRGFSAREYQESGIIDQLEKLPENQRLISNSSAFVLYHTNRFPQQVSTFSNWTFGEHNRYGERAFRERGAYLILIYPQFRNYFGDSADQLLETITRDLVVEYQDDVSGIYSYPPGGITQP